MHAHTLTLAPDYPDYDRCTQCGSLFRRDPVDHDALYGSGYWDREGHSTLEEQVYNVSQFKNEAGETKIDAVMKWLPQYSALSVGIEIGCAPGILLREMTRRFGRCAGFEYDGSYEERIRAITGDGPSLFFGSFPELGRFWPGDWIDGIVGMDILEHAEDGHAFMAEVHRLLKPGGVCVLMLPILMDDGVPLPERMYVDEHLAIYSQKYLREWFGEMFSSVEFDRWLPGHEVVRCQK